MYKLQVDSGNQLLTEDSKMQIYLSTAQDDKGRREKDSIPEKIALLFIKMFFAYSVSYFIGVWAIRTAYNERGYKAYGGEYILIFVMFVSAYYIISLFFKYFRRKRYGKKRDRSGIGGRNIRGAF